MEIENIQNPNYDYYEEEEQITRPFFKICRFCNNLKRGRSLIIYLNGLNKLKVCNSCRYDISVLRNEFLIRRMISNHKKIKTKEAKKIIITVLHKMNIGIQAGIHQNILDFII